MLISSSIFQVMLEVRRVIKIYWLRETLRILALRVPFVMFSALVSCFTSSSFAICLAGSSIRETLRIFALQDFLLLCFLLSCHALPARHLVVYHLSRL